MRAMWEGRLGAGGALPGPALGLVSSWGAGLWVAAICASSLVSCAATGSGAPFTARRAVWVCVCSCSISWHKGEDLLEEDIRQLLASNFFCYWHALSLEICPLWYLFLPSVLCDTGKCLAGSCCEVKLWLFVMSG